MATVTRVRRKWILAIAVLACQGAGYSIYRTLAPRETASQALARFEGCWARNDAACLYGGMSSGERKALGLGQSDFVRFFDHYVAPAYEGFHDTGTGVAVPSDPDGTAVGERVLASGNRTAYRSIQVVATPDGNQVADLVESLLLGAMSARHGRPGSVKGEATVQGLEKDQDYLASLGIKGIYRERQGYVTLQAWHQEMVARLKRRRAGTL